MGKYVATINLGGHKRGEVKEYADDDADLLRRLKAGTVTPAPGTTAPSVDKAKAAKPVVVNPSPELEAEKKAPAKKRAAAKKADPEPEESPEAEVPADEAPADEPEPAAEQSSVQTSWFVSPTQEG